MNLDQDVETLRASALSNQGSCEMMGPLAHFYSVRVAPEVGALAEEIVAMHEALAAKYLHLADELARRSTAAIEIVKPKLILPGS